MVAVPKISEKSIVQKSSCENKIINRGKKDNKVEMGEEKKRGVKGIRQGAFTCACIHLYMLLPTFSTAPSSSICAERAYVLSKCME